MTIDEVLSIAEEIGFEHRRILTELARDTVEFEVVEADQELPLSSSKLGGRPALPAAAPWPKNNGRSIAFVAQVDLGAQPALLKTNGFPPDGMLLFFFDAQKMAEDPDQVREGQFAVVYIPSNEIPPVVRDWPDDIQQAFRYKERALVSKSTVTLPPNDSYLLEIWDLDDDQRQALDQVLQEAGDRPEWSKRALMSGYADHLQADMAVECALVRDLGSALDEDADRYEDSSEAYQKADKWRLLMQIPSTEGEDEFMWGDMGCLYYWIRETDLRQCRFDQCWMIIQCG